jgi:S1-C subfamily serine protease
MKATVFRGQWVVALAHPLAGGFADGPASASWGIVGNVRRRLPANLPEEQRTGLLTQYGSLIQTDARLALGSSGGALFNLDGELIGLTAATAAVTGSEAAGGFAVPMDPIYRGIVGVLREGREVEYGFLGVSPGDFVPDGDRGGLVIARVTDRSPADRAGLQSRDVIRAIDGRPIRDADDLFLLVGGSLAGREVSITYTRGTGRVPQTATATLAKFVHPHPWIASVRPPAVYGLRVEWSSVLAQQNGPGLRNPSVPDGVVVRELDPKGAAAAAFQAAGLAAGKVLITRVNGTPVQTPADFYRAAGRGPVRLGVTDLARPDAEPRTITVP